MNRRTFLWSLTGVSAVLGFMLTVQLASRPASSTNGMASFLDLTSQIDEASTENRILAADLARQRAQLAQYQAAAGSRALLRKAFLKDEQSVAREAGMTRVSGPGITITIRDDPKLPFIPEYAGQFSTESDQLISQIVNDLFANGATAISINGQRLVTTSSIRLVRGLGPSATLQINGNPIVSPYVIRAIGSISRMKAVLTVDNVAIVLNLMQEDCIIRTHPAKDGVRIPAYNGRLPGQYAKEVGGS